MPSNRELKEEAEALGKELGVSVETEGLGNSKLKDLVESLYAQLDAKGAQAAPEPVAEVPTVAVTEVPGLVIEELQYGEEPPLRPPNEPHLNPVGQRRHQYAVGPRCSIVGPRGVLGPGREVLLSDFGPDANAARASLESHIAAGRIVKR